jgi:hypothetical protein
MDSGKLFSNAGTDNKNRLIPSRRREPRIERKRYTKIRLRRRRRGRSVFKVLKHLNGDLKGERQEGHRSRLNGVRRLARDFQALRQPGLSSRASRASCCPLCFRKRNSQITPYPPAPEQDQPEMSIGRRKRARSFKKMESWRRSIIERNRAVAVGVVEGPEAGLSIVDGLIREPPASCTGSGTLSVDAPRRRTLWFMASLSGAPHD